MGAAAYGGSHSFVVVLPLSRLADTLNKGMGDDSWTLGKFLRAAVSGPIRLLLYLYEERERLSWDKLIFLLFSGIIISLTATTLLLETVHLYRETVRERGVQFENEKILVQCRGLAGGPLLYATGTRSDCERASYVAQTAPLVRAFDTVSAQWPTPRTFIASVFGFGAAGAGGSSSIESHLLHYSLLGWLGMAAWYLLLKPARRAARARDIARREKALNDYQFMHLVQRFDKQREHSAQFATPLPGTPARS